MRFTLKKGISWLSIFGLVAVIVFYAYYQSRSIIAGPTITLYSPQDGEIAPTALVHVRGKAERANELTLDGRVIFIDLAGNFNEELLLFSGYNIIELAAKDTDGREIKKTIGLVWNGTESSALFSSSTTNTVATSTQIIQ